MARKRHLPSKNRKKLPQVTQPQKVEIFRFENFAGPLPPPEMLLKYDEVSPGLANRIVSLAENQSTHRQSIEAKVVDSNVKSQQLGLILGALICFLSIAGGIYLILNDKDI